MAAKLCVEYARQHNGTCNEYWVRRGSNAEGKNKKGRVPRKSFLSTLQKALAAQGQRYMRRKAKKS